MRRISESVCTIIMSYVDEIMIMGWRSVIDLSILFWRCAGVAWLCV
jgi:hypothetical protein